MTQERDAGSYPWMVESAKTSPNLLAKSGGEIPGWPGRPAFSVVRRVPSPIPVLLAVPHAGRSYPPALLDRMRDPSSVGVRLEDRYADLLARHVAQETGAGLVIAHAPRAMIDLNRAPSEMDWDMLADGTSSVLRAGRRARGGLGLVPRRLPGTGEIWKGRITQAELDARIERVHSPYHEALTEEFALLCDRWGCALLMDLHSMPPLSVGPGTRGTPEFVIGDRFGNSCAGALSAAAFDHFSSYGRPAAHNRPYAGGYVLDRHTRPSRGFHGMQLEVCRSTYLDDRLREAGPAFEEIAETLSGLVRRLAEELMLLGQGYRQAAE